MTTTETTREYRINSESVYLTKFGQAGLAAYSAIVSKQRTADALEAGLSSHKPVTADDALGLRFALAGVAAARAGGGSAATSEADRAAAIRAMAALEAETIARPAPVAAPAQSETCRHGVSIDAACAECDADFA